MARLAIQDITQSFGRFRALSEVSLTLASGEVVGILGENGAGKSTLLNILSGTLSPTSGRVAIDGLPIAPVNYRAANAHGIWRIFQDPALIDELPVYQNLFLGHEERFSLGPLLRRRAMVRLAGSMMTSMELDVDVRRPVRAYDFATRQALEVARAILLPKILDMPSGFVLFDEPTTGLTEAEVRRLLGHIGRLKADGVGIAFVSHRLKEVFAICDRLVVLKDGQVVGNGAVTDFDEDSLHRLMVGRESHTRSIGKRQVAPAAAPKLTVRDLAKAPPRADRWGMRRLAIHDIAFAVGNGEIVGIGGLMGSGKNQLLRLIAGLEVADRGAIMLAGNPLEGGFTRRKKAGIAFVPADRAAESILLSQSVAANIALASGESGKRGFSTRLGLWRHRYEQGVTAGMIRAFGIKAKARQAVGTLSGGNQQKVALARWVHREPQLLLIENPTAGVDVGAKAEIHHILAELAERGTSVLYVTDDLPELISFSDRILIMREGTLVAEVQNYDRSADESDLIAAMIGSAIVPVPRPSPESKH
ncbi:sugar ABC transporter ATP-binding protein [Acidisoma silvae]|uniref:Sugar ABC transporter ATP-binding protein n=1 Tax=Acidisoma silvae TaxID=2802396 RepID=A0A964E1R1_9PROT|nr:sugar ABC transporter ATP-binding protein [Acidisoma silvae]MCB8878504.1 sugar ABC transporter ATP-binding protein [Acidisoma silvae]